MFEAAAEFFCERRGFSRPAALGPTGPVAALLQGARSHLQQPKQLLLGWLAGLTPSEVSGSSRSLQNPAAWHFFVRVLCCLRTLMGTGWEQVTKASLPPCALPCPPACRCQLECNVLACWPCTPVTLQEWIESEEGVPLHLPCLMDLLANLYNTGDGAVVHGGPHCVLAVLPTAST